MQKQATKGLKGMKGSVSKFDISFIRMVAQEYHTGDLSYSQLAKKYGISAGQVRHWQSRYGSDHVEQSVVSFPSMTEQEQQAQDELKKQIEELAKKLTYANLKITGLEMMIDIAEKELAIDIRKKSGTKPSAE